MHMHLTRRGSAPCLAQVNFDVKDPSFKLDDLLKLELHKFEDEVGEIVDCAQKEEKMELALVKLKETWGRVEFQFTQFKVSGWLGGWVAARFGSPR